MNIRGYCRKCGKEKDIKEIYSVIEIRGDYLHIFGEKDCEECRGVTKSGEKTPT